MIIKLARTEANWKRCYEYLDMKGTPCLNETFLFYVEADLSPASREQGVADERQASHAAYNNEETTILACAGWNVETGSAMEPFQADDFKAAYKLFYFMEGFIAGKGYSSIQCRTNNEAAIKILEKEGYSLWTNSIKEFIRSV